MSDTKTICPTCKGKKVIRRAQQVKSWWQLCPTCTGRGFIDKPTEELRHRRFSPH